MSADDLTTQDIRTRIESITKTMDIPEFRLTSIAWLTRNAGVRNADHPRYKELENLLKLAHKRGIQS